MPRRLVEKPIPKSHTFPGGYKIAIVQETRPCRCKEKHLEENDDASYDTHQRRITLWVGLTPGQKWRRLYHELGHARLDAERWACLETGTN